MKKTLIIILTFVCYHVESQSITANEVINKIKSNVTCPWMYETVDVIKAGSGETKVTGIATTFMATMEVLHEAVEANCNMIITHEPTFYNHFDNLVPLENDPVQQAKLKYIEENNLVIFRFHDHIHMTKPDGITEGIVNKLGWNAYRDSNPSLFHIPKTTLGELTADLAKKFGTDIIRGIGDEEMEVNSVKFVLGAAGSARHFAAFNNEEFDVLLIGEAREWETIPYVADAVTLGIKKGLIVLGHADSEEAGMEYCAEWMEQFIDTVPVKFIPAGNPMWNGSK